MSMGILLKITFKVRKLKFKKQIVETYLQQDYEIWEQLDPVLPTYSPFITVPVDKIRKDI